jgi:hypothetical protein
MTPPPRRSPCSSGRALLIAAATSVAGAAVALPRAAHAQACCAGGALVTPTRLAIYEDYAVGLQTRARSDIGSFAADGHYATAPADQQFEQDLAAAFRFAGRAQASAVLPMIQTHRDVGGLDEWGGGVGDVALTFRYDFLLATERLRWPGIALLAGTTFPTGTAPDQAHKPLATDATGRGTYDVNIGIGLEKVLGHVYVALDGWLTHRFARTVSVPGAAPLDESFGLRWTGMAVAGYVFDNEAGVAAYVNEIVEGDATVNGASDPTTGVQLTTVGLAGVLPLADVWRVQGALFSDVMLSSFGRNQTAGMGLTLSLVRVWM